MIQTNILPNGRHEECNGQRIPRVHRQDKADASILGRLVEVHRETYSPDETLLRVRIFGRTVLLSALLPLEVVIVRQAPETLPLIAMARLRRAATI